MSVLLPCTSFLSLNNYIMSTFQLYIGSNNTTGLCELSLIESIISGQHDGFTIYEALGYWKGKPENSAVVIISGELKALLITVELLKKALKQEAIAVQKVPNFKFL